MVKMAVGAGTDSNANPGLKKRSRPAAGVAPAMLAVPALSGPGLVGAVLRADPGVWGGVPAPVVTPRWRRNGVDVPGATALDYVPGAADDGAELRCAVTATNASGTASAVTDTVRIAYPAPVVSGAPADRVLDQGPGTWTLDATSAFTGAGLTFGVSGAGATADPATGAVSIPLGTPRAAETVTVTAMNSGGSASVSFAVTVTAAPVLTAPASLVAPSLSGSGRVGAPMLVDPGVWSGDPTPVLSLRWRRNGAGILGSTGAEYTPVAADDGADLDCLVTAVNAAGSAEAATGTVRIAYPAPVVAGVPADRVLDQGPGAWTLDATSAFAGAGLTFGVSGAGATVDPATGLVSVPLDTPRAAETVTVTATNSGGSASVSFAVTVTAASIGTPPAPLSAPSLAGTGSIGTPMRLETGTWSGDPAPVLSVRWMRDDAYIPGVTEMEYVPVTADDGADLRGVVVARNAAGTAKAITEAVSIVHVGPAVVGAITDQVLNQGEYVQALDVSGAFTGAALIYSVTGAGAVIDPATGILSIPAETPRVGETVTVTATNSGGSVSCTFTVTVNAAPVEKTWISMASPILETAALRASRLAVRLEPTSGTDSAAATGFDLRYAQTVVASAIVGDGDDAVSWTVLANVGKLAAVSGLMPGQFVHLQCRAVTAVGSGPWSTTLSIALAPAETPIFFDTFSTGANAVSASARTPDLGGAWKPIVSGRLDLRQPQGHAVPAGSQSGTPQIDGRSFRGMWFDGGYWARDSGTIEIATEFVPGDRMTVIMGYLDPGNFVALRMRASSSSGSISLSKVEAGVARVIYSTAPTTLRPPPVGAPVTVRVTLTGGRVSLYYDDSDDVLPNSATVALPGMGWGVGGDQSNPQPQYFDSVRFYDVALDAFTESVDRQPTGLTTFVNRTPGVQIEDIG
jgi:PKD repeat protein